jgi:hypothetical protein
MYADTNTVSKADGPAVPWNKGKLIGQTPSSRADGCENHRAWRSERFPRRTVPPPPGLVRSLHRAAGNSPGGFWEALGQAKRAESCRALQRGHTNSMR